jgi:hypothetical protein
MNLRLNDPAIAADLGGQGLNIRACIAGKSVRYRDSVFSEQLFGLIFVDIH